MPRACATLVALAVVVVLGACTPPPTLTPARLTMTPTTSSFGSVAIGSSSAPSTFTVTNGGSVPTGIVDVAVLGANKGDFVPVTDGCSGRDLPSGGTCTLVVRFAPIGAGARSATLVATASPGGTVSANLQGTGSATPAALEISPLSQPFGSVVIGSETSSSFTVRNHGEVATGALKVLVSGGLDGTSDFSIESDECSGTPLAGLGTCTIQIRFQPTSSGAKSASLVVSATPGGSATASLSGTGLSPASITFTPVVYDYGLVATGSTSSKPITITNTGDVDSPTLSVTLSGDITDFSITQDECSGSPLAATGTCTVDVTFSPTSLGARSATLQVAGAPGGSVPASLSGTGANPASLSISPTTNDFGSVVVGSAQSADFTVTNNGGVPTTTALVVELSSTTTDFSITNDECSGAPLAATASCIVTVRFQPTSAGARSATLQVTGNPGGSAINIPMTAQGEEPSEPGLAITPASQDFGQVVVGSSSSSSFTVTNQGTSPTGTLKVLVSGGLDGTTDFSIESDDCTGVTLDGSASCHVLVHFAPTSAGAKTASLSLTATPGGTATASLTGSGT